MENKRPLSHISHFLFDMDGTIYLGNKIFSGTRPLFAKLKEKKLSYLFLTNNSSKSSREYLVTLKRLGIPAEPENILVSSQVTAQYLAAQKKGMRVFLVGSTGFREELEAEGIVIVEKDPEAVVLGFHPHLTYWDLAQATRFILKGVSFFASHPDTLCPDKDGPLIDCGCFSAALTEATGIKPVVFGKPSKEMTAAALKKIGGKPENTAIIGDRLSTDIKMGNDFGLTSILMLTGATSLEIASNSLIKPDWIFSSLEELSSLLFSSSYYKQ